MLLSTVLSALTAALAVSASSHDPRHAHHGRGRRKLGTDMRGLQRLRNETLAGRAVFPNNGFHGVNLGSWFVFEPYMAVDEWHSMGGDYLCGDCTTCVNDEMRLTQRLGQSKANQVFATHWANFINQNEVNLMVQYGINAVRIPLGYWIIENTVNSNEAFPQGGLNALRTGAAMLKKAGISILLDMHAAPGVQTASNPFTGYCTNSPQFWQQSNFNRMTSAVSQLVTIVHNEPQNFGSVWGIEAVNEPPVDGNQTPNYYQYMQQFVAAVRNAESKLNVPAASQLSTVYMDVSWQYKNNAGNAAYTSNGGNAFDSHLYYSFGAPCGPNGCVQNNLASQVSFACQGGGGRIQQDAQQYNTPSFLGEWWLQPVPGSFSLNDQGSIRAFGDAQKRGYAPEGGNGGYGSFFWSWKMTNSDSDGGQHTRSYKDAVSQGYLPTNAGSYFNSKICG